MKSKPRKATTGKNAPRPKISLRYELWELEAAVGAARIVLHECSADRHGFDAQVVRDAAHGAEGILSLVQARLHLVGQIIGRSVEAHILRAPHNLVTMAAGDVKNEDIFFDVGEGPNHG